MGNQQACCSGRQKEDGTTGYYSTETDLPPSYRRSSAAQMGASNQSYQFSSMAGTAMPKTPDQKPANVKKLRDLYTPDPPKPKEKKIIPGVPAGPTNNAEKKQQDHAQKNAAAAGLMAMQMQKGGKGNGMVKNIQVVQQPQYDDHNVYASPDDEPGSPNPRQNYARPREQLQKYEMNYDTMQSMKMGAAQLRDSGNRKSGTNVPDVGNRLPSGYGQTHTVAAQQAQMHSGIANGGGNKKFQPQGMPAPGGMGAMVQGMGGVLAARRQQAQETEQHFSGAGELTSSARMRKQNEQQYEQQQRQQETAAERVKRMAEKQAKGYGHAGAMAMPVMGMDMGAVKLKTVPRN
ncbi:unnamed protein product [Amoebophrya sp. A120]|nr:unnamed protein product [Amoebophrya sp. A120]|eukprot:GSA120T00013599001.1